MASKRFHQVEEFDNTPRKRPRSCDVNFNPSVDGNDAAPVPLAHDDYTIAWICALHLELTASRAMLDEEHACLPTHAGDDNTYVLGRIGQHNVVMVCLPGRYGTVNAAIVATNLKRTFKNIRATLMVGIGGAAPNMADLRLGDVVVGTRVMQYDMGKQVQNGRFQITGDPRIPAPLLNSAMSNLRSKHGAYQSSSQIMGLLQTRLPGTLRPDRQDQLFQASYEHPSNEDTCDNCDPGKLYPRSARLSEEPKIHYGVIASGNSVMKNAKARDDIARELTALCFEMEAAGMMDNLQCLPIRGICDYSDSHKNKEWQSYAAATAAAYARELLEVVPPLFCEPRKLPQVSHGSNEQILTEPKDPKRRQRLLESLNFSQINARRSTIRTAHVKTCKWLIHHPAYRNWLDPIMQSHNHGFFWLRGKAGAGKSTMLKFLFSESKKVDKPGTATISFFFNARGDKLEKSVTGMYRSLLLQLLHKFPDLQRCLDDPDIVPLSQVSCCDLTTLKELLQSSVMALGRRSLACFIDALDECDEQEARDMVQFFEDLAEHTTKDGIQFRVCFSSRPYPYISIRKGTILTLEGESGHEEDLKLYVKSNLIIQDPVLFDDLQSQILSKAAGIFLWVVLVVDILKREQDEGGLALRKKLSDIPDKLSELFRSILLRDGNEPERLLLCVLWILCAKRPLTPAEFRHALWIGLLEPTMNSGYSQVDTEVPDVSNDSTSLKLVTSSSKGLAEISKSERPTVQFIHESVRDFLIGEKGIQQLWPKLGFDWEPHCHERLKLCCNSYLSLSGIQATLNNSEDGSRQTITATHPFLEYATQHVLCHSDAAASVIPQDTFLSQFFASSGIRLISLFEKRKTRQYGKHATPLYVLADRGLVNLLRVQMRNETPGYVRSERYKHPFFAALANNHKDAVAALLGLSSPIVDGLDITEGFRYKKDVTDYKDCTPLTWAVRMNKLSLVQALVHSGADVNEKDRQKNVPILEALTHGHAAVACFLIEQKADTTVVESDGSILLSHAVSRGWKDITQFLIDNNANINTQDKRGRSVLMLAALKGWKDITKLLIEKGADIKVQDHRRQTILVLAASNGWKDITQWLIEKGADINVQDRWGDTILTIAASNGWKDITQSLIEKGAYINVKDHWGDTILTIAASKGWKEILELLIDRGANIDYQDIWGRTAMSYAANCGYEDIARLLFEKGADIYACDSFGSSALELAQMMGHRGVVDFLLSVMNNEHESDIAR